MNAHALSQFQPISHRSNSLFRLEWTYPSRSRHQLGRTWTYPAYVLSVEKDHNTNLKGLLPYLTVIVRFLALLRHLQVVLSQLHSILHVCEEGLSQRYTTVQPHAFRYVGLLSIVQQEWVVLKD